MKLYSKILLIPITALFISAKPELPKSTEHNAMAPAEYVIDLKNSKILWNIKTSRGGNNGELLIKSGSMLEENRQVLTANIEMDMTAIQIRSIPPGIVNMKAVTILNTESFFDVARYPTSRLEINRTIPKSSNSFEVTGFLTIKGRRHPIRFLMEGGFANGHFEGKSKNITVNRNLYNIKYSSNDGTIDKELDNKVEDAIDQSFTIDVFIVADIRIRE
jgi:polyisoprenoid-binding protein YceI